MIRRANIVLIIAGLILHVSWPWLIGMCKRIEFDTDGRAEWYKLCTNHPTPWCTESTPRRTDSGVYQNFPSHVVLETRLWPGPQHVTLSACNRNGCSPSASLDATITPQWGTWGWR